MNRKIGVVGLGYVGLPLAIELGKVAKIIAYDLNSKRIEELREGKDNTNEIDKEILSSPNITFTSDPDNLANVDFYIVTVPTPIDDAKIPDLSSIIAASELISNYLKRNDIVVYESTVYPGVTEEECMPILEEKSGLKAGLDFYVGYSPERINPGDKKNSLRNIKKIISAQNEKTLDVVEDVYSCVIDAGLYRASSIKIAEAAKVIENIQRDLNIALMNELSIIFNKMNIDTGEVLKAAGTKWNFLSFEPGLVGGHCIGVDPYYLTHKAEKLNYHPEVILAGRRINDNMGKYVAESTVKKMISVGKTIKGSRVLVLGIAFKENIPDIRNSKAIDIIKEISTYGVDIDIYDPCVNRDEVKSKYGLSVLCGINEMNCYDGIIIAVKHRQFYELGIDGLKKIAKKNAVIADVKNLFKSDDIRNAGMIYWNL